LQKARGRRSRTNTGWQPKALPRNAFATFLCSGAQLPPEYEDNARRCARDTLTRSLSSTEHVGTAFGMPIDYQSQPLHDAVLELAPKALVDDG
jgi:hypothetical protein